MEEDNPGLIINRLALHLKREIFESGVDSFDLFLVLRSLLIDHCKESGWEAERVAELIKSAYETDVMGSLKRREEYMRRNLYSDSNNSY